RRDVLRRPPLRGQPGAGGFDDRADLLEVLEELGVGPLDPLPAQDVPVEQVPLHARPDERAPLLPGSDQPLRREHAQRLADDRTAHVELGLQRHDVDRGALLQLSGDDPAADVLHGLTVHPAPRARRHLFPCPYRTFCMTIAAVPGSPGERAPDRGVSSAGLPPGGDVPSRTCAARPWWRPIRNRDLAGSQPSRDFWYEIVDTVRSMRILVESVTELRRVLLHPGAGTLA